jgi:hypothetical protein
MEREGDVNYCLRFTFLVDVKDSLTGSALFSGGPLGAFISGIAMRVWFMLGFVTGLSACAAFLGEPARMRSPVAPVINDADWDAPASTLRDVRLPQTGQHLPT